MSYETVLNEEFEATLDRCCMLDLPQVSFLTYLICSTSTILGTNGLHTADVPLSNKQTNKQNILLAVLYQPVCLASSVG